MGVKLVLWHEWRNVDWGCFKKGCWGRYLDRRGMRWLDNGEIVTSIFPLMCTEFLIPPSLVSLLCYLVENWIQKTVSELEVHWNEICFLSCLHFLCQNHCNCQLVMNEIDSLNLMCWISPYRVPKHSGCCFCFTFSTLQNLLCCVTLLWDIPLSCNNANRRKLKKL
jgi:hypothetical protein